MVVKKFFGAKFIFSGEESWVGSLQCFISVGFGRTLSRCMIWCLVFIDFDFFFFLSICEP